MKFITKIIIILIVIVLFILLTPQLISGTTLGTFTSNQCLELSQVCENCTYNNISTVLYPNGTIAVSDIKMSNESTGTYFNYTFCKTFVLGDYIVNGFGDLNGIKTAWVYDFEVTGTGFEFSQSRSTFYIAMLVLLIFFFILTIISIPKLPKGNDTDDYGLLIGINKLKYLRPVLFAVAWGLLLTIVFTSSNVALAYLGSKMFGNLLFAIYRVMFALTLPGIIIWFIFIFVQMFRDNETKKILERGIDIRGQP